MFEIIISYRTESYPIIHHPATSRDSPSNLVRNDFDDMHAHPSSLTAHERFMNESVENGKRLLLAERATFTF